jgi:hypothetical protein
MKAGRQAEARGGARTQAGRPCATDADHVLLVLWMVCVSLAHGAQLGVNSLLGTAAWEQHGNTMHRESEYSALLMAA